MNLTNQLKLVSSTLISLTCVSCALFNKQPAHTTQQTTIQLPETLINVNYCQDIKFNGTTYLDLIKYTRLLQYNLALCNANRLHIINWVNEVYNDTNKTK